MTRQLHGLTSHELTIHPRLNSPSPQAECGAARLCVRNRRDEITSAKKRSPSFPFRYLGLCVCPVPLCACGGRGGRPGARSVRSGTAWHGTAARGCGEAKLLGPGGLVRSGRRDPLRSTCRHGTVDVRAPTARKFWLFSFNYHQGLKGYLKLDGPDYLTGSQP